MNVFDSITINLIFNIFIIVASIALLWKGADYLVDSACKIAETFGISDLVIGLTVVAFGTSAPEFAVTINAAIKKQPDISVGNIVGSNIFNLGIILGSVAVIKSIQSTKKLVYRDGFFMFSITLLLLFFFRDFELSRVEGLILMAILVSYLCFLFLKKEQLEEEEIPHARAKINDYIILPLSIAAVVAGGHYLVQSASFVASYAGVSQWVIGVTIVAAGTSAPELATSLAAVLKGKHGLSAGNLIGSDLFNILGVLGLAGTINPLTIHQEGFSSLIMLSAMVGLVIFFLRTGWRLNRWEGLILIAIGISRWIYDFMK